MNARHLTMGILILLAVGCANSSERNDTGLEETQIEARVAPASGPAPTTSAKREAEIAFQRLLSEMGVEYLPEESQIEIAGWVNMQSGLIEVFACAPEGKTHEAVVVLDCVPSGLHAGLLALGLEPGSPVEAGTAATYRPPTGSRVRALVRWIDPEEGEQTARIEEWIWDMHQKKPMDPVEWLFAGSFMQAVTGAPGDETYAANSVKSLVTTYHDASTVLENPLASGADDTVYYANDKAVPAAGTPVTVIFRAAE